MTKTINEAKTSNAVVLIVRSGGYIPYRYIVDTTSRIRIARIIHYWEARGYKVSMT